MPANRPALRHLLVTALVAAALPSAAHAATPVVLEADAGIPDAVTDAANTTYAVWIRRSARDAVRVCRLTRGATACTPGIAATGATAVIPFPGQVQQAFVRLDGANVRVIASYGFKQTAVATSTDGGRTFGAPATVYDRQLAGAPAIAGGRLVFGALEESGLGSTDPSTRCGIVSAALDGSQATGETVAELPSPDPASRQCPADVVVAGDRLVAAATNFAIWTAAPGADPAVAASWGTPATLPGGAVSALVGGPDGAYAIGHPTTLPPGRSDSDPVQLEVRRLAGGTISAPVLARPEVVGRTTIEAAVDTTGGLTYVHAPGNGVGEGRVVTSTDGGRTLSAPKTFATSTPAVAISRGTRDHQGVAFYLDPAGTGSRDLAATSLEPSVVDLEAIVPFSSPAAFKRRLAGPTSRRIDASERLEIFVPRGSRCVQPGQRFRYRVRVVDPAGGAVVKLVSFKAKLAYRRPGQASTPIPAGQGTGPGPFTRTARLRTDLTPGRTQVLEIVARYKRNGATREKLVNATFKICERQN